MVFDDVLREAIIKSQDAKAIKRVAIERGMKTLRESAMAKVVAGLTSIDEAVQKTQTDDLDLGL
jgi:type II secretory ATPase GspE/PulE/Tfp pilus assembly ATPase PilB-like protein